MLKHHAKLAKRLQGQRVVDKGAAQKIKGNSVPAHAMQRLCKQAAGSSKEGRKLQPRRHSGSREPAKQVMLAVCKISDGIARFIRDVDKDLP